MKQGALRLTLIAFFLLFTALSACSSGSSGGGDDRGRDADNSGSPMPPAPAPPAGTSQFSLSTTADENGRASVSFTLPEFTNKFSVSVETPSGSLRFISVENDRGDEYVSPRGEEINLAKSPAPFIKAVNVPSRIHDPAVLDFATYTANAAVSPRATAVFTINVKSDPNLSNGGVLMNVFRVGTAVQRSGAGRSIDEALLRATEILALQAGITPTINNYDIDGPDSLPSPLPGNDFYLSATSGAPSPAINIFIGGDIDDTASSTLGITADIPVAPIPSRRSAVAISLFASAGPDGRFSDAELRLLGETIAHESGHYMGLFHPVDIVGASVAFVDPLGDTPQCTATVDCLTNDGLIRNLMFPFPVPDKDRPEETLPQERLTTEQRGVLNRYVAVD